ncbi:MAG: OPT/YSL family transporter [Candidatus Bathyarchaeia archaeon]
MGESQHTEILLPKYESGLTKTTVLAILYAIVVFIPALIYLTLMTGGIGGIPVAWFTLLLWVEIARLSGRKVSKQEACMILILTGAEMVYPLGLIYNAWYRESPIAKLFGISEHVPNWVAPAPEFRILDLRTFFHQAWIWDPITNKPGPITLSILSTLFFGLLSFGLALWAREIFLETERLPFPMEQMSSVTIVTLTGEKKKPLYFLAVSSVVGFAWGFVVYALPFLTQAMSGRSLTIIPVPWYDFSDIVQRFMPGAILGLATDIGPIASGFIFPLQTIIGIAIGSFAIWFFGNYIVNMNWETWGLPDANPDVPGVQSWWEPGMNIHLMWQRSVLYFWMSTLVGIALAVGLAPIIRRPHVLYRSIASAFKPLSSGKRYTDPISFTKVTLPMLLVGLIGGAVLFIYLVPDFVAFAPWYVPIMIAMPFITTLIGARMRGETGVVYTPEGTIMNLLYYASGYRGVDVWFAPDILGASGHGRLQWFKICELTETKTSSLILAYWLLLPVAMLVGYLYVQLFWWLAPIPSGRYPGAAIYWDISATMRSLWIKGRDVPGLFAIDRLFAAFVIGVALYFILDYIRSPISFIAIGAGMNSITPGVLTWLIGGIIAYIIRRRVGEKWWNEYKMVLAGGLVVGEGLAVTLAVAFSLIAVSIWGLPY